MQWPNGIGFSPDEETAYITKNTTFPISPKTVYAYDVVTDGNGPVLTNRPVFAMLGVGTSVGIKTDAAGNVYAG